MKLTYLLFVAIMVSSCNQGDDSPCFSPPEPFRMMLLDDNGNDLLVPYREESDTARLFYISEGMEIDISSEIREGNPSGTGGLDYGRYYLQSRDVPWLSFDDDINTFYLDQLGTTDTINVEVFRSDLGGQCLPFLYDEVSFNGEIVEFDTSNYVYVMRRE